MINATPLAPLALPPNLPPSSCFAPLLPLDAADSRAATALSPAQQEFSSLQAWLSAPRTLQLPLHQVECQQEQKGRALQRLLLQAHLQQRGPGDVGRALYVNQDGQKPTLYSHRRLHTRVLRSSLAPSRSSEWATAGRAPRASIRWMKLCNCQHARSLMSCKSAWSRQRCRERSGKPASALRKSPVRRFPCAASKKSFSKLPRTSTPSMSSAHPQRRPVRVRFW